jgi:Flp pilus assembly secretin CpaC
LVRDDQVLVLGGLMRDEVMNSDKGVPFLKDIPFIGRLFSGTGKKIVKKNLMVFIHPKILHDDGENAERSQSYYDDLRDSQRKFNDNESRDSMRLRKPLPELDAWPHDHGEPANIKMDAEKSIANVPAKISEDNQESAVVNPAPTPETVKSPASVKD